MVAAAICKQRKIRYAVRTGAVNAGHTVYHEGKAYKMQQLPTGWVNDQTVLVIGPGAYINPEQLKLEIKMIVNAGWLGAVLIDRRAGLHLPVHTDRSTESGRHYSIGATGKGCSEAILDRIRLRGKGGQLFIDWWKEQWLEPWMDVIIVGDTAKILHKAYDRGESILLEGTQGTFLDLYLGPYPYTTHKQSIAAQWVTEAGLAPGMEYETILCARTYPIRVAGNSGPMPDEIDWPTLAIEINGKLEKFNIDYRVKPSSIASFVAAYTNLQGKYTDEFVEMSERNRDALQSLDAYTQADLGRLFEYTTVTRKLRRVARMNYPMLAESVMLNRPASIALTFINYEFPEYWNETSTNMIGVASPVVDYVRELEDRVGCDVRYLSTGAESHHFHDLKVG